MDTQSLQLAHRVADITHDGHLVDADTRRHRRAAESAAAASTSVETTPVAPRRRRRRLIAIGAAAVGAVAGVGVAMADQTEALPYPPEPTHQVDRCDAEPSSYLVFGPYLRAV